MRKQHLHLAQILPQKLWERFRRLLLHQNLKQIGVLLINLHQLGWSVSTSQNIFPVATNIVGKWQKTHLTSFLLHHFNTLLALSFKHLHNLFLLPLSHLVCNLKHRMLRYYLLVLNCSHYILISYFLILHTLDKYLNALVHHWLKLISSEFLFLLCLHQHPNSLSLFFL